MLLRRAVPLLALVLLATPLSPARAQTPAPRVTGLSADLLADLDAGERSRLASVLAAPGEPTRTVSVVSTAGGRLRIDTLDVAARGASRARSLLGAQPGVSFTSLASPTHALVDPYAPQQWALPHLHAPALRVAQGAVRPVVAVIDSGVDAGHPDLDAVLVGGYDATTATSGTPADGDGHGTHVSGIIGAEVDNGVGGEGLLSNVALMPVKALDDTGAGNTAWAAAGLVWAVDHGAGVANLSLGGADDDPALRAAVAWAESHGVVVVAAAGNEAQRGDAPSYPGAYPTVLAVGATDEQDARAAFSNTGPYLDVVAPGVDVLSTCPVDDYCWMSGTSMASPYAAAVTAAVRARFPALTPAQVRARVTGTAHDLGPVGVDDEYGSGEVDPLRALDPAVVPTAVPAAPVITGTRADDRSLSVSWGPPAAGARVTAYRLALLRTGVATRYVTVAASARHVTATRLLNGTSYAVRVQAASAAGWSATSRTVRITPRTVSSAPRSPRLTAGSTRDRAVGVTATWLAPATTGGTPLTTYVVRVRRVGTRVDVARAVTAAHRSLVVTGLLRGARYTLTVQAKNAAGSSALSSRSGSVTAR